MVALKHEGSVAKLKFSSSYFIFLFSSTLDANFKMPLLYSYRLTGGVLWSSA